MKKSTVAVLFVILIAALLGVGYWEYFLPRERPAAQLAEEPPPEKHAVPSVRYPLAPAPAAQEEKPLPTLNASDPGWREVLAAWFGAALVDKLWFPDHYIQRLVLLVDSLPKRELPLNRMPMKPAPEKFTAAGPEGSQTIDSANYRRYAPYVRMVEAVDAEKAVAVYSRFYPLFQEAYRELGYPSGYFNDRLMEVLDHLLAAPEIDDPVRLVRPAIRYQFADPKLEALSAGQKIMLRIGSANALKVKAKLREIRRELILRQARG